MKEQGERTEKVMPSIDSKLRTKQQGHATRTHEMTIDERNIFKGESSENLY